MTVLIAAWLQVMLTPVMTTGVAATSFQCQLCVSGGVAAASDTDRSSKTDVRVWWRTVSSTRLIVGFQEVGGGSGK